MSCDCREFTDLLLDLAYGELDADEATRLERHAAACAECGAALAELRLTRKMVGALPEPAEIPPFRDAVLAEAARAAALAPERRSDTPAGDVRISPVAEPEPGFFGRLRAGLFRPAFATALAAVAVFAVSFFLYRQLTPGRGDEAPPGGAPFFGPAGELVPQAAPAAPTPEIAMGEERRREGELAEQVAGAGAARSGLATGRALAPAKGNLGTAGPAQVNSAERLDRGDVAAADELAAAAAPWPAATGDTAEGKKAAGAAPAPTAAAQAGGGAGLFRAGMDAYDRGDCAAASALLERVVDDAATAPATAAEALHHLARCARRSGSCGLAVIHYERLFAEYPGYPGRPEALWEAAACQRRLGHLAQALALLEELAQLPGWADRAAAERRSIEALAGEQ